MTDGTAGPGPLQAVVELSRCAAIVFHRVSVDRESDSYGKPNIIAVHEKQQSFIHQQFKPER